MKPEGMSDYKFRKIKKYIKLHDEFIKGCHEGKWDGTAKNMVYPTKYGLAIGEIQRVEKILRAREGIDLYGGD